jgi:hypothetical protein
MNPASAEAIAFATGRHGLLTTVPASFCRDDWRFQRVGNGPLAEPSRACARCCRLIHENRNRATRLCRLTAHTHPRMHRAIYCLDWLLAFCTVIHPMNISDAGFQLETRIPLLEDDVHLWHLDVAAAQRKAEMGTHAFSRRKGGAGRFHFSRDRQYFAATRTQSIADGSWADTSTLI